MAEQVARRKAKEFRLVIAGDLFDFSRTTPWFSDELRPYVSLDEVNEQLEQKTLGILNATAKEASVKEALEVFHLLAKGRCRTADADDKECDFPSDRIEIFYFPEIMTASAMPPRQFANECGNYWAEWRRRLPALLLGR